MKKHFALLKKIGVCVIILSTMLAIPNGRVYSSDKEIKFVKEDTVCKEILDLGLTEGTMNYGKNLTMSYNSAGNVWGVSHGMGLRIEVFPEADGALKRFNDTPVYKPPARDFQVLQNIRSNKKISWIEKGANITGCTRLILYRDNILITIKGTSLNSGGFDVAMAADILEKHALTVLGDKLQEYFFSGIVKGSEGKPLSHAQVVLVVDDQKYKTTTDASGYYSIDYKGSVKKGFDCGLFVVLQNVRNEKAYYRILWGDKPVWVMKRFKLSSAEDLMQDLYFLEAQNGGPEYAGEPALKALPAFSAMYFHMSEALDFFMDYMKFNLDYKLPVDVVAGYRNGTYYTPVDSTIYIDYRDCSYESPERPMNREWHEFSHHAMFSMYGKWPSREGSVNHAGYINPSTGDSFMEGFAEFMSMMIADYYKYPNPHVYSHFGSLEANYKAWDHRGMLEEFAVAGILWDLYDGLSDDGVQMTANDIWFIMKDYHPDFDSVYRNMIGKYPGKKAGIDEVFKAHAFFADKTAGNGKWDAIEPYRDGNGNRKYDSGEYFIDYGLPRIEYTNGETLGPASNYQRPERKSAGMLPGQFIKVNNQVLYYLVEVSFPDNPGLNYQVRTENRDGLVYVQAPPSGYGAMITVTPEGAKGNILTFTAQEYEEKMPEAIERGYFLEHDFQVSGEALPQWELPAEASDGAAMSPPHWEVVQITAKAEDYNYTPVGLDFLPAKAGSTMTGVLKDWTAWIVISAAPVIGILALILLIRKKRK